MIDNRLTAVLDERDSIKTCHHTEANIGTGFRTGLVAQVFMWSYDSYHMSHTICFQLDHGLREEIDHVFQNCLQPLYQTQRNLTPYLRTWSSISI